MGKCLGVRDERAKLADEVAMAKVKLAQPRELRERQDAVDLSTPAPPRER
jgi:chorismate mutase